VLTSLAKNPANRYQTAGLMGEDLLRAANGQTVDATPVLLQQHRAVPAAVVRTAPPRRRSAALVYSLFGLLLLTVVLGVALTARNLLGGTGLVATPEVAGLSQSDAEFRIAADGLALGQVQARYDSEPLGTVLEQTPVPGVLVGARSVVDLVVSQGVEMTRVPRVRQLSRQEAEAELRDAKLTVSTVIERNGTSAPGIVLRVMPGEGTAVPADRGITLVVSSGVVAVPSVVGQSRRAAEQQLQSAGFNVGVSFSPDAGPPGRVLSQVPATGTAQVGGTVVLAVSERAPVVSPMPTPPPSSPPTPTPSGSPSASPSSSPSPSASPTATPTSSPSPSPTAGPLP